MFSKGPGFLLYKIVDDCVDASFPMLRKMGNKLERIEEEIFEGESEDVVRDISNVKQEIINFRKIVRPQRAAFRDLERNKARYIAEDLDIYFDDINDASERVWDMLENYKEVIEGLESTNESQIAHRTNETFRVLTAISVIVLPLTLIASIWGMNVGVPGERVAHGVLGHHRPDGGPAGGDGRLLPQAGLALTPLGGEQRVDRLALPLAAQRTRSRPGAPPGACPAARARAPDAVLRASIRPTIRRIPKQVKPMREQRRGTPRSCSRGRGGRGAAGSRSPLRGARG